MNKALIVAEHFQGKLNASTAKCLSCVQGIGDVEIDIAVLAADAATIAGDAHVTSISVTDSPARCAVTPSTALPTALPPWKDRAQISKTYVPAIATGNPAGVDDAFTLVYGASSLFHPQLAATRAQAAVLLTVMGDHTFYGGGRRTAAGALASASPAP